MIAKDWINLAAALAWPLVALGGLIYIWRSDAIGKLIRISDAVKDLNHKLSELVEAEQRLRITSDSIISVTTNINQTQEDLLSMKSDVESIRDKVEQRSEQDIDTLDTVSDREYPKVISLDTLFPKMDHAWQMVVEALRERFGWFDGRSVAVAARGFTHGNRKGLRLTYDQADELARLHSTIKSYRRRQSYLRDWLTVEDSDQFIAECENMTHEIKSLIIPKR